MKPSSDWLKIFHQSNRPICAMSDPSKPPKAHHDTKLINSFSGIVAGGVVSVALAPLDVIRMRIMVNKNGNIDQGLFKTGFSIFRKEGIPALYKGLGTSMIGLVPNWGIYFFSYEYAKESLENHPKIPTIQKNILASVYAGAITTVCTSPLWVIRTRMMTQVGDHGYQSLSQAFKEIFKAEGIAGFYHGLLPSVFGLVHVAIQFPLYEYLKSYGGNKRSNKKPKLVDILIASSVSKFCASIVAYPHEVLRSRLQDQGHGERSADLKLRHLPHFNKYSGMAHVAEITYKQEGIRGFYKGMLTNLVRVIPSAAITLGTFEIVSSYLKKSLKIKKKDLH
jgi:solute carrier family 25 folate transporter 32